MISWSWPGMSCTYRLDAGDRILMISASINENALVKAILTALCKDQLGMAGLSLEPIKS